MKHFGVELYVDIPYTGREKHSFVNLANTHSHAVVLACIQAQIAGWDVIELISVLCTDGVFQSYDQVLEENETLKTQAKQLEDGEEMAREDFRLKLAYAKTEHANLVEKITRLRAQNDKQAESVAIYREDNNTLLATKRRLVSDLTHFSTEKELFEAVAAKRVRELQTHIADLAIAKNHLTHVLDAKDARIDEMEAAAAISNETIKELQQQWQDHLNTIKELREQGRGYLKTLKETDQELFETKGELSRAWKECNKHKHKVNKLKKRTDMSIPAQIEELRKLVETVHTGLVSTIEAIQASDKDLRTQLDKKFNAVVPYLHHHYPYCI